MFFIAANIPIIVGTSFALRLRFHFKVFALGLIFSLSFLLHFMQFFDRELMEMSIRLHRFFSLFWWVYLRRLALISVSAWADLCQLIIVLSLALNMFLPFILRFHIVMSANWFHSLQLMLTSSFMILLFCMDIFLSIVIDFVQLKLKPFLSAFSPKLLNHCWILHWLISFFTTLAGCWCWKGFPLFLSFY